MFLEAAELKFIAWAGSQLLSLFKQDETRALECRARVAGYFDELADALNSMTASMRNNQIPTAEGNRLRVLAGSFEITMASNFFGRDKLKGEDGAVLLLRD